MRFSDSLEFAAGDDIETGSLLGEETKNRQSRVGFDGVTDGVGAIREGGFEELEAVRDLLRGIDVHRRAVLCGEG